MGFEKVIIVGYGDKGKSEGYESTEYKNDSQNFVWSDSEIHSLSEMDEEE